jgi:hypothetical protein
MSFLPIVARELRIRSRAPSTYWWRCAAALVAGALTVVMMTARFFMAPGKAGKGLFAAMSWLAWMFCIVEGVRNTADCLSEEKREGTLGLLFLTDLRGYDVVLGKLIGTSLGTFFSLLAALPIVAMALLQGGVTAAEFGRMCLVLSNTLFFCLASGLLVSAFSRHERQAWLRSLLLVSCFVAVPPLVQSAGVTGAAPLEWFSPYALFRQAFAAQFVRQPGLFWNASLGVLALGCLWLILASLLLPRSWQDKTSGESRGLFRSSLAGSVITARSRARLAQLRSLNPVLWLTVHQQGRSRLLWTVAAVTAAAGLVTGGRLLSRPPQLAGLWVTGLGFHLFITLWVAWLACRSFGHLRRTGLLELLLATPMPVWLIVKGVESALRRHFFWPVALVAASEVALCLARGILEFGQGGKGNFGLVVLAIILTGGGLALWVLDMMAVARVGMWLSLTSRKPAQAWAKTVLWVLVGPFVVLVPVSLVCCGLLAPGFLLFKDILFINWAVSNLRARFRETSAQLPGAGTQTPN